MINAHLLGRGPLRSRCYKIWLHMVLACASAIAMTSVPTASQAKASQAGDTFYTVFASACRVDERARELGYASDVNSLSGLADKGAVLIYVIDIGNTGPPVAKSTGENQPYEAFGLFVANQVDAKDFPTSSMLPARGKSVENASDATTLFRAADGKLWSIEWRASVTFESDLEPGGMLEGQGGLLSDAEYADMIAYLQTRPFRLLPDWKSVLSAADTLPVCKIKWTQTDRYLRLIKR
ncbi:MAG: hypothetical protein J0H27_00160 [Xanthomonadales bacterium]|nr:hypothetical protein [Xanthomonadales bacterium]